MQKQTQKLFTAFLPKGCSRLLKAQSAAVSEIYLLYFCPKKEYLPLHLPIHCLLMYHSATNPYNQHCINAIFPPDRTQLALSFLIITLLIPRGSLPVPSPEWPHASYSLLLWFAIPTALPHQSSEVVPDFSSFLSALPLHGTPLPRHTPGGSILHLSSFDSELQLFLLSVLSQCPAQPGAPGWPSRGPSPSLAYVMPMTHSY